MSSDVCRHATAEKKDPGRNGLDDGNERARTANTSSCTGSLGRGPMFTKRVLTHETRSAHTFRGAVHTRSITSARPSSPLDTLPSGGPEWGDGPVKAQAPIHTGSNVAGQGKQMIGQLRPPAFLARPSDPLDRLSYRQIGQLSCRLQPKPAHRVQPHSHHGCGFPLRRSMHKPVIVPGETIHGTGSCARRVLYRAHEHSAAPPSVIWFRTMSAPTLTR